MAYEKNPDEIGALWLKRGNKGLYMTGEINGQKVVCFAGKGGEGDKLPAWRVNISKPQGERAPSQTQVTSDDVPF